MCGIIGIASNKSVSTNIINSLKKLEYRGYDSAGLATLNNNEINEKKLKLEVERLCKINVLKKVNHSQWAAPCFAISKKDGTIRFLTDFRELNKRIKCFPFPIPNIQDLLNKLQGFQWIL